MEKSGLSGRGCGCGCVWGGLPWRGGGPGSPKRRGAAVSGSPQAMSLWLPHLHLLLRNMSIGNLGITIAPPNPISIGGICSPQQSQTSLWFFSRCPLIETHPCGSTSCAPQSLCAQHQSLVLFKHRIFSPGVWSAWCDST